MSNSAPPPGGAETASERGFDLYLQGNEDGEVELVCTHRRCMRLGERTNYNPEGLWLRSVAELPYRPRAEQVARAWRQHLAEAHGDAA